MTGRGKARTGRPKGSPNKTTAATRERIETLADPIGFMCGIANGEKLDGIEPSIDRRIHAARWLGDRLISPAKGRLVQIDLLEICSTRDVSDGLSAVVTAIGGGRLSAEQGAALASIVEVKRKVLETIDLEQRISAIEAVTNPKRR